MTIDINFTNENMWFSTIYSNWKRSTQDIIHNTINSLVQNQILATKFGNHLCMATKIGRQS